MFGLVGLELPLRVRLKENNRGREDFEDFDEVVDPSRSGDVGTDPGSSKGPRAAAAISARRSAAIICSFNLFSALRDSRCSSVCASAMKTLAATFPRSNIDPFLVFAIGVGRADSDKLDAKDFADAEKGRTAVLLGGSAIPGINLNESFMHFLAFW